MSSIQTNWWMPDLHRIPIGGMEKMTIIQGTKKILSTDIASVIEVSKSVING